MRSALSVALLMTLAFPLLGQDYALKQLEDSPRHHEWVTIDHDDRSVHAFVAYPESSAPTPVVLVIHENRGLTDWVRSFADQVAAAGYLAVAPDLLSDFDDDHVRTSDFASSDAARDALYQLDPDQITDDLKAVRRYAAQLPASNGTVAVAGFCWGGSQTFRFATNSDSIAAALVFYGSAPTDPDAIAQISAPVHGFYGGNDERINATIPATREAMEAHQNPYDVVVYDGAGHAFMRRGDDPAGEEENRAARDAAWERIREILGAL